jgi:general secretion pathway protein G
MMKRHILPAGLLLALLTLLAWIAVPNFLTARNRSRQKRTMADIRTIATAWEARSTDRDEYTIGRPRPGTTSQRVSTADLARALEPKYVKQMPRADGWGNELQFTMNDVDEHGRAQGYAIRALGSDDRPDRIANMASGATTDFADDIIYSNGSFVRYPESAG